MTSAATRSQSETTEPSKLPITAATNPLRTISHVRPSHLSIPRTTPSRLTSAFSSSTSLSSSALLTLSQPAALSLALHLSTSSQLSERYHCVYHLLIPLAKRWGRKTAGGASDELTEALQAADNDEAVREAEERKEKQREDTAPNESKAAASSEDEEMVAQLHQFLSTATHIVLTSLPQWTDSTSHSYVIDLLAALMDQLPVALPLLLSSLHASISQASNKPLTLLRDERPLLMQADGVVVAVERVADGKAAERVKEVANAMLLMLERVMEGERCERYRGRVKRLIQRLLFSHPSLVPAIIATLTDSSPPALFTLSVALSSLPATVLAQHTRPLLAVYEQSIVSSKDATHIALHADAFASLFPLLTSDDLTSLLPAIDRQCKRSPELVYPSLAQLLSGVRVELSAVEKQLLPSLVSELRHADEGRRRTGQRVLRALVERMSEEVALTAVLQLLIAHVQGKHGVLSQWQLRASLLTAISSLAHCHRLTSTQQQTLSATAIEQLSDYLDKESSAEARTAGIAAIGDLLPTQAVMPDKLLKHLSSGINRSKDGNSISACLLLLADVMEARSGKSADRRIWSPAVRQSAAELIGKSGDVLLAHIKNATSKPLQHRKEGIVSIALLLLSASPSSSFSTAAASSPTSSSVHSKVYLPLLRDVTSFVNSPDLLSSCGVEEAECYLRLVRPLLSSHAQVLLTTSQSDDAVPALYPSVIRLCVHKQWTVRRLVLSAVRADDKSGHVLHALLRGLESVVQGKGADTVPSSLYARLILSLFTTAALPATAVPLLLSVSCDPLVCASTALASQVIRHMQARQPALLLYVEQNTPALLALLTGEQGFSSSLQRQQQTASSLFIALYSTFPAYTASNLFPPLLSLISPPLLLTPADYDIAVFHTPDGQLCTAKREGELHLPVTENKNVKGRTKQDEEFARMQKEIDKKKGKVDDETKRRIAEQGELRLRMRAAMVQVEAVLTMLGRLCEDEEERMQPLLIQLLPALQPLLLSQLLKPAASQLHRSLLHTLPPQLRSLSLPLALSVQLAITRQQRVWDDRLHSAMLKDLLAAVASRVKAGRMMGPSGWLYVSPLIRCVLLGSREQVGQGEEDEGKKPSKADDEDDDTEVAEATDEEKGFRPGYSDALAILVSHCPASLHTSPSFSSSAVVSSASSSSSALRYPLTELLTLLLHLLNHVPSHHSSVSRALLSLAPALLLSDVPALLTDDGIFSVNGDVRAVVLDALGLTNTANVSDDHTEQRNRQMLTYRVYIAAQDAEEEVREKAATLLTQLSLGISSDYLSLLLPFLSHPFAHVRSSTASAIAAALVMFPKTKAATVASLLSLFRSSSDVRVAGRLRGQSETVSKWQTRDGVALTLQAATPSLSSNDVVNELFTFFLSHALRDDDDTVWADVLQAGLGSITAHGKAQLDTLLPLFTRYSALQDSPNEPEDEHWRNDRVREGSVIYMGTIARHMQSTSEDLLTVMSSLVTVLNTPSHSVQRAAADCITPLMQHTILQQHAQSYLNTLLGRVALGAEYGERKGASFGIGAMIKGLRLQALRKYGVLDKLATFVADKSSTKSRQGALFAYERLFVELGSKFEPYTVVILPHLLANFGDVNLEVREAATECAKAMMGSLTGYAVKMVLPLILAALNDSKTGKAAKDSNTSWRTKQESITLLGTMAHLNPQQLSTALPLIVPRLLDVGTDPNAKVQAAAKFALRQIGSVIRNPEIAVLVPILLAALNDPSTNTKRALSALIHTSFVHSIDPPSLALIVPIVKKGLRGRTAPTRKMAAQVVGSICELVGDVRDILPYASTLLKHLHEALLDQIPEVRTLAAKALGSLYSGIRQYDESSGSLLDELCAVLEGDTNSVQRSGAAQGLAQVLVVEGMDRTRAIMPKLYAGTDSDKAVVREGYYNLFQAMPDAFVDEPDFADLLPDIFPVIVKGLADEQGLVREAALAAGISLVLQYASTQTELLLPALEEGLLAEDWRIRLSSVQLIGVLLLRLAGLSGKYLMGVNTQLDEDEDSAAKEATTVTKPEEEADIVNSLGIERRDRVFALMYMLRSDTVNAVREMGWRVWKGCVVSTPRMLNTVLPTLMSRIISDLASSSGERQHAAQAALGELVGKLGESVLAQIVPILQTRLDSDDAHTRQGVCLGMSEVLKVARKSDINQYMSDLIPAIRDALCDESTIVRAAAGRAFMTLYKQLQRRAIDEILPALIEQLDESEDDQQAALTLGGLREVIMSCGEQVMPYLLPVLTLPPLTLFHTKALAALSDLLGKGMQRYMASTTSGLIESMAREREESVRVERREAINKFVTCIQSDSVSLFLETITNAMTTNDDRRVRIASCQLLSSFVSHNRLYYDSSLPLLLQSLLQLWNEEDVEVVHNAWDAVDALSRAIPDERMSRHIVFIQSVLTSLQPPPSATLPLHGLTIKKGLAPFLPGFQHALLHGVPSARVSASDGLGLLVVLSSESTLAPHVIKLTGPLIRIVGDRFPADVKASILHTLQLLIVKCGRLLKPFVPQLQTTFIKHLQDENASVRGWAAVGLSDLMLQSGRVEVVVNELLALLAGSSDAGVRSSVCVSLSGMFANAEVGGKVTGDVRSKVASNALSAMTDDSDAVRREAARCLCDALVPLLRCRALYVPAATDPFVG